MLLIEVKDRVLWHYWMIESDELIGRVTYSEFIVITSVLHHFQSFFHSICRLRLL